MKIATVLLALAVASGCATQRANQADDSKEAIEQPRKKRRVKRPRVRPKPVPVEDDATLVEGGEADPQDGGISWYHDSLAGRLTANGERYSPRARTCAHKTHKFGTRLRVTIVGTGASAVCRVNDRGPFVKGRVLDVSRALAEELDIIDAGVAEGHVVRLIEADGDG